MSFKSSWYKSKICPPKARKRSIAAYVVPISANKNPSVIIKPMALPPVGNSSDGEKGFSMQNCKSIIGEATTPERPVEVTESDMQDTIYEDPGEIPTIKLNEE
ncbi:transcriptional activator DEMETER-like isoform X1 [Olea europaea subsp. europaea]|uniref:Transcriptional activator DEMETER-like isoform X1 n=1 Tax=Olea europaea subsp. europaea TaxID=158383 RepID=A0A8S0SWU9_OLEEU|nr:transcriptional activator DEMETER-like isoform X1 [Olea europaea subsp. europaea]